MKALDKIPAWAVVVLGAGIFLVQNLLTPHCTDDYAYSFIWDGAHDGNFQNNIGELRRVESIGDIFVSQWSHWLMWGGRSVAHFFVQFFMMFDKIFFDVANALAFTAVALLIYFLAAAKFELRTGLLAWIFFGMWFCLPEFYQTTLWLTGSCNYLWMTVLQLGFLLPYVLKFRRGKFSVPVPVMIVLGVLAGWSNESGGAAAVFLAFLALIYFWRRKKLERWILAGFLAAAAGFALLMFAPGDFHRMALDEGAFEYNAEVFLSNLVEGLFPTLAYDLLPVVILAACFLRGKVSRESMRLILALAFTALALPLGLMLSPEFPARAAFISPVLLLVAATIALSEMKFEVPRAVLSAAGIFLGATVLVALYVDASVYSQFQARAEYVAAHKSDEKIIVDPIEIPAIQKVFFWNWTPDSFTRFYNDLTPYERINRNKTYAKYYGLKKIVVDEAKWKQLEQFPLYDD